MEHLTVINSQTRGAKIHVTGGIHWALNQSAFRFNGDVGLEVTGNNATVSLTGLELTSNRADGLNLRTTGEVVITEPTVASNARDGLEIHTNENVQVLRGSFLSQAGGYGLHITSAGLNSVLENNTLSNNRAVARVPMNLVQGLIAENVLNDTERGIGVLGAALNIDARWPAGYSYVLDGGDYTIAANAALTLEAGAVLKFAVGDGHGNDRDINIAGRLVTTEGDAPVVFTSLRDDSAGGDTNLDGVATEPERGNWGRLRVDAGGSLELRNAELRYGGSGDNGNCCGANRPTDGMLSIAGDALLDGVILRESLSDGIHIEAGAGSIRNTQSLNNGGHGLEIDAAVCGDWERVDNVILDNDGGNFLGCE